MITARYIIGWNILLLRNILSLSGFDSKFKRWNLINITWNGCISHITYVRTREFLCFHFFSRCIHHFVSKWQDRGEICILRVDQQQTNSKGEIDRMYLALYEYVNIPRKLCLCVSVCVCVCVCVCGAVILFSRQSVGRCFSITFKWVTPQTFIVSCIDRLVTSYERRYVYVAPARDLIQTVKTTSLLCI